jgi:hypothetical protein
MLRRPSEGAADREVAQFALMENSAPLAWLGWSPFSALAGANRTRAGFHMCHLNAENLDRIEDTTECLLALSVFGANHA